VPKLLPYEREIDEVLSTGTGFTKGPLEMRNRFAFPIVYSALSQFVFIDVHLRLKNKIMRAGTGKTARLPAPIHHELNRRLDNGALASGPAVRPNQSRHVPGKGLQIPADKASGELPSL
jgi:hypothetical protein